MSSSEPIDLTPNGGTAVSKLFHCFCPCIPNKKDSAAKNKTTKNHDSHSDDDDTLSFIPKHSRNTFVREDSDFLEIPELDEADGEASFTSYPPTAIKVVSEFWKLLIAVLFTSWATGQDQRKRIKNE